MSFVDFVVLPPGHGRSVTYFWGWDAHEARLRCPDGVWEVIEEDVVPGGVLNLNSTNLPRPWSPRESSPSRKFPMVERGIEPGNSWLVVRDWPLDQEAGPKFIVGLLIWNIQLCVSQTQQTFIMFSIVLELFVCCVWHIIIQGDSKRWTQFRTSIFPELYTVCEWST